MNITFWIGQQAAFNCTGEHFSDAKWTKDGLWLSSSDRFMIRKYPGESQLRINPVTEGDSGIYVCNVTSALTPATAIMEFSLTVLGSLVIAFVTPPQTVLQGGRVELQCDVYGVPTPNIYWRHVVTSGCGKQEEELVKAQANGSFVIEEVTQEHIGVFQCLANSTMLTDEQSSSVSVVVGE